MTLGDTEGAEDMLHNAKRPVCEVQGSVVRRTWAAGQEEDMIGKEHGRRHHKHLRRGMPFPCPTQTSNPDSHITPCLNYIQMRRWKSHASHQIYTTSPEVSPRATLLLPLSLRAPPKHSHCHCICETAQVCLLLGLPCLHFCFFFTCLLLKIKNKWRMNNLLNKPGCVFCSRSFKGVIKNLQKTAVQ